MPTWIKCPKCDGQGTVSKPPYVAGDVHQWSSTSAVFPCNVCNGEMVLFVPDEQEQPQEGMWEDVFDTAQDCHFTTFLKNVTHFTIHRKTDKQ